MHVSGAHTWHTLHVSEVTMGWLRLVGSLKLQVSFAEYSLFYRALLQKRPIVLRSLLIVATPYCILHRLFDLLEYSLFYRALLQKRPIVLRSLLIVATPYCILHRLFDLLHVMCPKYIYMRCAYVYK